LLKNSRGLQIRNTPFYGAKIPENGSKKDRFKPLEDRWDCKIMLESMMGVGLEKGSPKAFAESVGTKSKSLLMI